MKKLLFVLIFIFVLFFLFISYFVFFNKEEIKENYFEGSYGKFNLSECDSSCEYKVKIKDEVVIIKYEKLNNVSSLYFNNSKFFSDELCSINLLDISDSFIALDYNKSCEVYDNSLLVYDFELNKILELNKIKDMYFKDFFITMDDNDVLSLFVKGGIIFDNKLYIDNIEEDLCSSNLNDDSIAFGTYYINFIDKKFSDFDLIIEYSFGDLKYLSGVCSEEE